MKEDETKRGREWLFDEPDEQVLFAADDWKLAAVCDRRQQTRDDCLRAFRLLPSEAGESEYDECEAESRMLAANKRGRHQPRKAKKARQAQQLSVGTRKVRPPTDSRDPVMLVESKRTDARFVHTVAEQSDATYRSEIAQRSAASVPPSTSALELSPAELQSPAAAFLLGPAGPC